MSKIMENFVWAWYHFFFKSLVQFTSKTICGQNFLCVKAFYFCFI